MKSMLPTECYNLVLSHSLATAAAAQILAHHVDGMNADQAFLTGLFFDLGLFVQVCILMILLILLKNQFQKGSI